MEVKDLEKIEKDFYNIFNDKISEIKSFLKTLKIIDEYAENVKVIGNKLKYKDKDVSVEYSENSKKFDGKTYKEFIKEMKDFFKPIIKSKNDEIKKEFEKKPIKCNYLMDWKEIDISTENDENIISLDTIPFSPSYVEVYAKLNKCSEKNGGVNGIITGIPSVGIVNSGLNNSDGFWIENNQIKIKISKNKFDKIWIGNCKKVEFKIIAWA